MPDPSGFWIGPALDLSARLAATPTHLKAQALLDESIKRGLAVLTLRRAVLAARYCVRHAKSVGMHADEVVAAILAIEILMRLERRDKRMANGIRKEVLRGEMSVRELRKRLRSVPEKRPRGRLLGEWASFALGVTEQFYSKGIASITEGGNSYLGKLLRVDIEVSIEGCNRPHAIYMSPLDDFSECAGMTLDDQIPFMMAACLAYPQVNLAYYEDTEAEQVSMIFDKLDLSRKIDFRVAKLHDDDNFGLEGHVGDL